MTHEFLVGYEIEMLSPYSKTVTKNKINSYLKAKLGFPKVYNEWVHSTGDASISRGNFKKLEPCEIISYPFEYKLSKQALAHIFEWMHLNNCKTNTSTGLHVNISFKDKKLNHQINPAMLLANMEDDKVVEYFKRSKNRYCASWAPRLNQLWKLTVKHWSKSGTMIGLSFVDYFKYELDQFMGMIIASRPLSLHQTPASKLFNNILIKYHTVNFSKLPEHGYLEFRPIGGKNYQYDPHVYDAIDHFVLSLTAAIAPEPKVIKEWVEKHVDFQLVMK